MAHETIQNVADTALWVAHYRAQETERSDALFRDPFAKLLVGERGRAIAGSMGRTGRNAGWTVVIRTVVIDQLIESLVGEGVTTVVNLGAGMDTRPYRMKLPSDLRWIEVDYAQVIDHKEKTLGHVKPLVALERQRVDLANQGARQQLLRAIAAQGGKVVFLTEGVIPYLSEQEVEALAADLRSLVPRALWVTDYMSNVVYRHLRRPGYARRMQNAPFQFFPSDWLGFFSDRGWTVRSIRYIGEESVRVGRPQPMPWWAKVLMSLLPQERVSAMQRTTGYMILEPSVVA
ncbi:MAG: SAM-dependent methyltransferase [Proteobacteria bacterium]|nr:SAM-dependent methyltransferase [Pseudomonadota bacterium]